MKKKTTVKKSTIIQLKKNEKTVYGKRLTGRTAVPNLRAMRKRGIISSMD